MCRLYVRSNLGHSIAEDLNWLIISNGGDGDGFIHSKDTEIFTLKKAENQKHNINGLGVTKIFYQAKYKKQKYGIQKIAEDIYEEVKGNWFFYHTRISSTDSVNINNTHPYIISKDQRYLLMQNGHETIPYTIEPDYKALTNLIQKIDDEELLIIFLSQFTNSNFFVIDTKEKLFYIFSNKRYGPLEITKISNTEFIIASEPIYKESTEFIGVIIGKIYEDHLEIIDERKEKKFKAWDLLGGSEYYYMQ